MTKPLIVALAKGRIMQQTLPLLKQISIVPKDNIFESRQLLFATNEDNLSLIVVRATDVPNYVITGAADLGIVGKDVLLETALQGYCELLDLQIAQCRLMTAGLASEKSPQFRRRVATKFPNIARQYYAQQGIQAELIKFSGAMELAPNLHLADEIVDIVDSGDTLRANHLVPRALITNVSARLIVNRAVLIRAHMIIKPLVIALQRVLSCHATSPVVEE